MPNAAATLDEYRAAFGDDVKIVRAAELTAEGLQTVGKWAPGEAEGLDLSDITPPQPKPATPYHGKGVGR